MSCTGGLRCVAADSGLWLLGCCCVAGLPLSSCSAAAGATPEAYSTQISSLKLVNRGKPLGMDSLKLPPLFQSIPQPHASSTPIGLSKLQLQLDRGRNRSLPAAAQVSIGRAEQRIPFLLDSAAARLRRAAARLRRARPHQSPPLWQHETKPPEPATHSTGSVIPCGKIQTHLVADFPPRRRTILARAASLPVICQAPLSKASQVGA